MQGRGGNCVTASLPRVQLAFHRPEERENAFLLATGYFFEADDLIGLGTLRALDNVELDLIPFFEALIAFALDGTVMNEDIGPIVTSEETVSLRIVEPFDCTFVMCQDPDSLVTFRQTTAFWWRGGLSKRV